MITAKNYAAKAAFEMTKVIEKMRAQGQKYYVDSVSLIHLIDVIKTSQHFVLPDGGMLFQDNLKGIVNSEIKLPFQRITIEYYMSPEHQIFSKEENLSISTKRVAVVQEVSKDYLDNIWGHRVKLLDTHIENFPESDNYMIISSIYNQLDKLKNEIWVASTCAWVTPSFLPGKYDEVSKKLVLHGKPLIVLPGIAKDMINFHGEEKAYDYFYRDLMDEINATFELCEALSCKNVSHDIFNTIDKKKNTKRIKSNKLPIYETRQLIIDAPTISKGKSTSISSEGPTRNSPRQHLRRGHIRVLESGDKIWINPCTVGDPSKGIINKTYSITTDNK